MPPKIESPQVKPTNTQLPAESVLMFLTQIAMQLNNAQQNSSKESIRLQQEIQRAKIDEQMGKLKEAGAKAEAAKGGTLATLAGVVEKHAKLIAQKLRSLFPSVTGKEDTAVERGMKLLKTNESAAMAKYASLPMKVQNNAVAVPLPITPDLVEQLNQLVSASQQAIQKIAEQNSSPMMGRFSV